MKERVDLTNTLLEMVRNGRCEERYVDSVYDAIDYINANKEEAKQGESTYVRLEDIQKFPIRKDHHDKRNGNEHFIYGIESLMEYIELLPRWKIEDNPFTQSNELHIMTDPIAYTGMTGWDWDDKDGGAE